MRFLLVINMEMPSIVRFICRLNFLLSRVQLEKIPVQIVITGLLARAQLESKPVPIQESSPLFMKFFKSITLTLGSLERMQ